MWRRIQMLSWLSGVSFCCNLSFLTPQTTWKSLHSVVLCATGNKLMPITSVCSMVEDKFTESSVAREVHERAQCEWCTPPRHVNTFMMKQIWTLPVYFQRSQAWDTPGSMMWPAILCLSLRNQTPTFRVKSLCLRWEAFRNTTTRQLMFEFCRADLKTMRPLIFFCFVLCVELTRCHCGKVHLTLCSTTPLCCLPWSRYHLETASYAKGRRLRRRLVPSITSSLQPECCSEMVSVTRRPVRHSRLLAKWTFDCWLPTTSTECGQTALFPLRQHLTAFSLFFFPCTSRTLGLALRLSRSCLELWCWESLAVQEAGTCARSRALASFSFLFFECHCWSSLLSSRRFHVSCLSLLFFWQSMWCITEFMWIAKCFSWVPTVLWSAQWGQISSSLLCSLLLQLCFIWCCVHQLVCLSTSKGHYLVSTQDRQGLFSGAEFCCVDVDDFWKWLLLTVWNDNHACGL